jgi:hypothetical protein
MTDSYRRIYLEVPFADLKAAKILGAQWDQTAKAWFIPAGIDPAPLLNRWPRLAGDPASHRPGAINADGQLIAAKQLGRLGGIAGGQKGGKARAAALTPERRREIAMQGVKARAAKKADRLNRQRDAKSPPLSRYGSELRAGRGPAVPPAVKSQKKRPADDAVWEGRAEHLQTTRGGSLGYWQTIVANERQQGRFLIEDKPATRRDGPNPGWAADTAKSNGWFGQHSPQRDGHWSKPITEDDFDPFSEDTLNDPDQLDSDDSVVWFKSRQRW